MKKTITFLLILSVAFFSLNAQTKVTIAQETFGNYQFGVNEHGPDLTFHGIYWDEAPYDTLNECTTPYCASQGGTVYGFNRHFDDNIIQEFTDSGYFGFTIKNGNWMSLSQDSSIQLNNYVLGNSKPYPQLDDTTGGVNRIKLHLCPTGRYSGSWDSVGIFNVDISRYEGTLDSISVEFGLGKRNHSTPTKYHCGLVVDISMDNGATWVAMDTTALGDTNFLVDTWRYIQLPAYTGTDVATANTIAVRFADVNTAQSNQLGLDDIKVVGWGNNLPTLTDIDVISLSGANTITTVGGTLAFGTDVTPKTVFDTTVLWSVEEGTGCATIDADGVLTATGNGTITVVATANDGGGAEGTYAVTISGQTVAVASIAVTSTGSTLAGGNTMQMTATAAPHCADNKEIVWSVGNTAIATISASGLLTPVSTGTAVVTATNTASGVTGTKPILISVPSSITDIRNTNIIYYPNPTTSELNLENVNTINTIEVLSLNGSVVARVNNDSDNSVKIGVSDLESGIYFIRLQDADGSEYMGKFVKK